MIRELELLEVLLIILRVSNSGIVLHNDPAIRYSTEFKSMLEANLRQYCSINVDKEPSAFKDIYKMRQVGK